MKKNMQSLLFTLLTLMLLTLLVSFILSILYFFQLLGSVLFLVSKITGFLILFIGGFLLGKNIREKTFFFALGFAVLGFLLGFIFIEKSLIGILILAAKWFIFVVVAMFSRNL